MEIFILLLGIFVPVYGGVSLNLQKYSFTLTTQSNLEKLFFMEEELIGIFSTFLREEFFHHGVDEDESKRFQEEEEDNHVHIKDLMKNKALLDDAKRVHRMIESNYNDYLKHPINVYHLMRRMRQWADALDTLFKSEPCQKWNMPELTKRILNIKDGLPTEENLFNIAYDIVILKHIYNLNTADLFAGKINNHTSLDPMSPKDIYDIARIAFRRDDYYYSAIWAKYLASMFTEYNIAADTYGFNMKNLFSILASSYYQLGQNRDAMVASQMVLRIDPDSKTAQSNVKFFEGIQTDEPQPPLQRILPVDKTRKRYEAVCKGDLKKPPQIAKKYYCTYKKAEGKMFIYEKMEILNFKPRIVQFYDVFDYDTAEATRYLAYQQLKDVAHGGMYFHDPSFATLPNDKARKKWIRGLHRRLNQLPFITQQPYRRGRLDVRNVGLEGLYYDIKDSKNWAKKYDGHTSSIFAFLRNVELGGEMVFPYNRVRITPVRGSAVFFYPSRCTMMICPVGYDTEWLAVTSFFEMNPKNKCRDTDEV